MDIDWNVAATIAAPIIALIAGIWLNRRFEKRPKLISYFGHVSSFNYTPSQGQPVRIHTHSVVLRNAGARSSTNVRLHHSFLPDFQIWPTLKYWVEDLPNGARDIVIPTLVPGEQVTVSYLYFPPLTADGINAGVKHDEGFAQQIPVLLQRQYPAWFSRLAAGLMLAGAVFILYAVFELSQLIMEGFN